MPQSFENSPNHKYMTMPLLANLGKQEDADRCFIRARTKLDHWSNPDPDGKPYAIQ